MKSAISATSSCSTLWPSNGNFPTAHSPMWSRNNTGRLAPWGAMHFDPATSCDPCCGRHDDVERNGTDTWPAASRNGRALASSCGWLGIEFVVLNDAELMVFWIVHHHHSTFVIVVTCAGPLAAQAFYEVAARIDVINLNAEVDAGLAVLTTDVRYGVAW